MDPAPAEADWPPELRLPPPPAEPPPPPPPAGMDDSHFLGSIIGHQPADPPPTAHRPPAGAAKRKRGRPPKTKDGAELVAAPPRPPRRAQDEEEVVCFICFDGGELVVCDRRGCPKVYHPSCIKRDKDFFTSRTKWNCGWHICSSCEKAGYYMCYTCPYSVCKVCIKPGKFFSVRGTKGFCDTCFGTIVLIESKDKSAVQVDFDDSQSWEYLFKLYWLDLKGKLSLTLEELTSAKDRWNVPNTSARKEKEESSDDLYDIDNEDDAGSDCSSRKRRQANSSRKKGRKRQKVNSDSSIAAEKVELPIRDAGSLPMKMPSEVVSMPAGMKWATPELLEFIGHMRDGDQSCISQFDVQTLLLEYIKKNNLRDPKRKSQIVCDARLHGLFRKSRVAHFEMLKLLEMHFLMNEPPGVNDNSKVPIDLNSAQVDTDGYSDMLAKLSPDKRRMHRKMEKEVQAKLDAYAAVDMHNINLIYMRRSLVEDLIDDATFSEKVHGALVRIKISGVGQKQDVYRLVKVVGTHKVSEKYRIGKNVTNLALEILNLDKKEIITMDTISNQDFTEEECNRLRQSMKCGLISRLKVGDVQEKAKVLQSVRVNDWFENEKQRLEHLRDRASETGRRKELREYVEKLQLLNDPEERTRKIHEVLEVHVDSHMDPNYESAEEMDDKNAVGKNVNLTRPDTSRSRRKPKYPNALQNQPQIFSDSSHHPKNFSMGGSMPGLGAGRKFENSTKANAIMYEAGSHSSSGVTMSNDMEPEKVWHYKDPSGNVQGPFTLLQLSKWTSYFPRDLRVWLTFESEERSLLLTEVLSKQQKDFTQAASLTNSKATPRDTGHIMNSPSVDQTNALCPVGYSMLNYPGKTVQPNKYSVPEREIVNSPDDSLSLSNSSVPPKDAHTMNSQAQFQTKHSVFVQSPGSPYGQTDLHHDGVQGGCSGESNHHYSSGVLWSPTTAQMSCSGQGNMESHHDQHASWSQCQHDSKNSSQGGSVKDLNSRQDLSKNPTTQRVVKDVSSPVFAWSPSESRTASSQHEGSCLSSTTNPSFPDELHSSVPSAKPKSYGPATPIEDRGSSSPSGMLSHSERVPVCSPQSAPSAPASDMCKMDESMNQQRTLEADMSNASVNQSPQSKIFPVSSPDNQDDCEFPSPTPRSENKEPAGDNVGLTPTSPENVATTCSPGSDACKVEEIVSQQKILEVDAPNSSGSDTCKVEEIANNKKTLEVDAPNSSGSDTCNMETVSHKKTLEVDAPPNSSGLDTCNVETVNHKKTLEVDAPPNSSCLDTCKVEVMSHQKNLEADTSISSGSDTCKVEVMSHQKILETDALNSSVSDTCKVEEIVSNQKMLEGDTSNSSDHYPQFKVSSVRFSNKKGLESEFSSSIPRSENKVPAADNSFLTSAASENLTTSASASEKCKEELVNQQETLEADASNAPLNQPPHSNISPVSSDNQGIEREYRSPTPRPDTKVPLVNNSVLTSAEPESIRTTSVSASDTCKMEILNKKRTPFEADTSNASSNQLSSPDNQDIEREYPNPTRRSENKEPVVENTGLTSEVSKSLTSASAPDLCKVEISNEKSTPEENPPNGSVTESHQSKVFLVSSPGIHEREFPTPTPRPENKEPVIDTSGLTSATPENLTTNQPVAAPETFVSPESGPPNGESGATDSDFKGEEIIQKELYCESESTLFTRENMAIDPSCGAESIDVSDVLESLMEQRCGALYMQESTELEDLLAASAEEPQCSSPIALSPWGESSYYQGDAVDSALWGVQDDPISDMWPLLSPMPTLQPSSGIETEGKETYDMNEVAVVHDNNEIVQRGSTPGVENVNQGNLFDAYPVLPEQVTSKPNDIPIQTPADKSTGLVGLQSSASQNLNVSATWSTHQNLDLYSNEKAVPSSNNYLEASRKQESAGSSVSSSGDATGNTNKGWNPPSNVNRGIQRNHRHRDKYSQISESWLLSSNHSRSRSDRFSGGSSRSTSKGQTRGLCKFHESGNCRKGASCSNLHP